MPSIHLCGTNKVHNTPKAEVVRLAKSSCSRELAAAVCTHTCAYKYISDAAFAWTCGRCDSCV